nr:TatD family hydrolase [Buchnera aphidicola]
MKNKNKQIELFRHHLHISDITKKPLIIHNRCADYEIFQSLNSNKNKSYSGVIHSFTGTIDIARKFLDAGFYISFSGIITFKKSNDLRKVLNFIPLNRLCIETDAPYLSPEPYRGIINQPYFLYYIAKTIQEYLKIDFFEFTKILNNNFFKLFNVEKKNIANLIDTK